MVIKDCIWVIIVLTGLVLQHRRQGGYPGENYAAGTGQDQNQSHRVAITKGEEGGCEGLDKSSCQQWKTPGCVRSEIDLGARLIIAHREQRPSRGNDWHCLPPFPALLSSHLLNCMHPCVLKCFWCTLVGC